MTEIGSNNSGVDVSIPARPEAAVRLAWASATDVGHRRHVNEDSYVAAVPLFAVADGMGGHSAGDLASQAVVTRLAEIDGGEFVDPELVEEALLLATEDITVIALDSELGVGTTVTGAVLTLQGDEPYFAVFNIGDSRVYKFEANELSQVTTDHSVVQELVESGALSREEAENHPDSNIITRAVGFSARPYPDFWMLPLRTGLRLLICSDGLTKEVSDDRLRLHLAAGLSPQETAGALVDAALAAGGRDNVTAVVVDVLEAPDQVDLDDTAPRLRRL
ncbi:protein phosphatase [Salinibacterium sp. CAN_S4]|uniref:PP2C family protein-serine/threonine phosphatase n=1 Tax=Salinibacterium sp. CAN_S4 TaxID=2787727 RepID=UPI0018F053D2